MKREFKDYVADIVDAIEKIDEFTQDMGFQDCVMKSITKLPLPML
jgi:uncharacterized protein with HEPN domain